MKCTPMYFGKGVRGFVCGPRRLYSAQRCQTPGCEHWGERQCDFRLPSGKTCDKYLCTCCAVKVGRNRDHCPDHPGQMALAL